MSLLKQSDIKLKGTTVIYDAETDEYEIDLQNASIISMDSRKKVIRIKIKSNQIHKSVLTPNNNNTIINTTEKKEVNNINDTNTTEVQQIANTNSQIVNENKEETKYKLSLHKQSMKQWFTETIRLPQYFELFISEGYEDLTYFDEDVIDDDLIEIGIKKKPHRRKILKEIKKLIVNINNNKINTSKHIIPIQNNNNNYK
eukprot:217820_1